MFTKMKNIYIQKTMGSITSNNPKSCTITSVPTIKGSKTSKNLTSSTLISVQLPKVL